MVLGGKSHPSVMLNIPHIPHSSSIALPYISPAQSISWSISEPQKLIGILTKKYTDKFLKRNLFNVLDLNQNVQ